MTDPRPRLILASQSPRRRELLAAAGYEFEVLPSEVDESPGLCSQCGPAELVARLAIAKGAEVVRRLADDAGRRDGIVVACDTVAEIGGTILGKPADEDHARYMIELLSGQLHRVYSGLCLWPMRGVPRTEVAITTLRMDPLDVPAIDDYIASRKWEGKAGAFGYQDGLDWLHVIQGSESNVVGLPMELLAEMLAKVA
ncbi:MAG: Maf family protein [Planctomycetia bacterium]|nr:Maf family protein [Planctomycetia bacterium]